MLNLATLIIFEFLSNHELFSVVTGSHPTEPCPRNEYRLAAHPNSPLTSSPNRRRELPEIPQDELFIQRREPPPSYWASYSQIPPRSAVQRPPPPPVPRQIPSIRHRQSRDRRINSPVLLPRSPRTLPRNHRIVLSDSESDNENRRVYRPGTRSPNGRIKNDCLLGER